MELKFNSTSLERYILSYIIKDKSFYLKIGKYLKTSDFQKKSYFQDSKLQCILNAVDVYYTKYDKIPSLEVMKMIIDAKFKTDELLKKSMLAAADEIYNNSLEGVETQYLQDEAVSFVKTARAVEATLLNEIDISNGKFDSLNDRMMKAVNINLDKDMGISLANSDETLSLIQEVEEDTGLTYGTPALDRIFSCPRGGEITAFCGTPGIGKTIWLGNIAVENMKLHKKGVFFSLEVDRRRLAKRLYSSLLLKSGVDLMKTSKEEVQAILSEYEGGDIRIKNYPANVASCNDFDAYLSDLYTLEGFKPDFIVIDYILITAPNNKKVGDDNMYSKSKAVTEEMRNLAVKWECPVFTAAQINRDGQGDKGGTKAVVTSKNLSESRGILDTVDNLVVINQTEAEKKLGEKDGIAEQRLFIDKSRNGKNQETLTVTIDYNTMSIRDGKKQRAI